MPFLIEFNESIQDIFHTGGRSDQVSNSEVVSAGHLSETTARHSHDTSVFKHIHAVDKVGLLALLLALIDKLLREMNSGETVHSALNFCAGNVSHLVESLGQDLCFLFKCITDSTDLVLVEVNASI